MARRNAASDHRPIPVSASGVMLEEKIVPNGVGTGRPPAKFLPPRTVWQSLQLPIAARSRPFLTRAGSKDCAAGGSIAASAGRQAIAKPAAAARNRVRTPDALSVLNSVFGLPAFRGAQEEIVRHVTDGGNCLVLMPTGGGKSLCYQLPSLLREGCGIVVSPLIALMRDQVAGLLEAGVNAAVLNSTLSFDEAS